MQIGIIGGLERAFPQYEKLAEEHGHRLLHHSGQMAGRGRENLEVLVNRSSLVVVLTDVNSHGAVLYARRYARSHGRRCLLLRRLGVSRFHHLLCQLASPDANEEHCPCLADGRDWAPLLASG